jgi:hypothetical protein
LQVEIHLSIFSFVIPLQDKSMQKSKDFYLQRIEKRPTDFVNQLGSSISWRDYFKPFGCGLPVFCLCHFAAAWFVTTELAAQPRSE